MVCRHTGLDHKASLAGNRTGIAAEQRILTFAAGPNGSAISYRRNLSPAHWITTKGGARIPDSGVSSGRPRPR
jgi:hypothetical protein